MNPRRSILLVGLLLLGTCRSYGQTGVTESETKTQRWRVGVVVQAADASATGIIVTTPVPTDWPEQHVEVVDREVSSNVGRVSYRTLNGGVRQMVVTVPRLAAEESATAIMTYDVTKTFSAPPIHPDQFAFPKNLKRDIRKYLAPSPYIESRDPRIRSILADIIAEDRPAWEQVAGIYDWVRENIRYEFSPQIKSGLQALEDGVGDCEELTSLIVALCRANRIPARSVWVPNHCYPEFYLIDAHGTGHWIPCQAAGDRAFGNIPESRPILQKGDSFRVQGYREALRYVRPTLIVRNTSAAPTLKWVLERVTD